jgi:hypothetical protein
MDAVAQELSVARQRAERFAAEAAAEIREKLPEGETVDTAWDNLPPRLRGMVHALLQMGTFEKLIGALMVKRDDGQFRRAFVPGAEAGTFVESDDLIEAVRAHGAAGVEFGWPLPKGR